MTLLPWGQWRGVVFPEDILVEPTIHMSLSLAFPIETMFQWGIVFNFTFFFFFGNEHSATFLEWKRKIWNLKQSEWML